MSLALQWFGSWGLNCKLCFSITRPLGSEPSHLSRIFFLFFWISDEPRTRWEVPLIFWRSFWKNLCRSPERFAPMDLWKIKSLFLICIDSLLTSPELPQPEITKIPLIFFFTISLFKINGLFQFCLLDSIDNWFVIVRPNLFHLVHQMQTHTLIKFHWFEYELWNLFHWYDGTYISVNLHLSFKQVLVDMVLLDTRYFAFLLF